MNTTVTGDFFATTTSLVIGTHQWFVSAVYDGSDGSVSEARKIMIQNIPGGGEF